MKNHFYRSIMLFLTLVSIVIFTFFSYIVYRVDVIPLKYFLTFYISFLVLFILFIYLINRSRKYSVRNVSAAILVIFDIIFILLSFYINDTYNFISKLTVKKDYLNYSIVSVKNKYQYKQLDGTAMGYIGSENNELLKSKILEDIVVEFIEYEDIYSLYNDLINDKNISSFVVDSELLNILEEQQEDLYSYIEVVYTFNLEIDVDISAGSDITKEPFILYISGIDQYGDVKTTRGRSDVNIIAIINPKTNKILLVNTPRDYYVQLAGTTGLRDKLTHAGIYGIDKSITTLEELYDIDIDHYVRVNFNTLISLIDEIGGVDIEADKSFRCYTNKDVYIKKGWNHLDGKGALAYSRERRAYVDGDHHRGRNQEQVITAVINKVTKSSTLLTKYGSILSSLGNTFQTDMSTNMITSFIKYQIGKMPNWEIESTEVSGFDSSNYTHSMGTGYKLYVMEPDYETINAAKAKMMEVLGK